MKLTAWTFSVALPICLIGGVGHAYQEAPMLAEQVAAGVLPPVGERLPEEPRVIQTYGSIGQYGGTWRRAFSGPSDRWGPTKLMEERVVETVMDSDQNVSLVPGWVGAYEVNDDASEYTFTIRKGLKWSDGEPVTTRDVRFWYEDVFLNEELMPSISALYTSGGEPMTLSFIDEYSFVVTFKDPYPLFLTLLAKESTGRPGLDRPGFIEPFHYLKDYHPAYADSAALQAVIDRFGVKAWTDLWDSRGQIQAWWFNPDMPVLTAWRAEIPPPADTVVMVRNPYYYGVDEAGNQLPYIDRITHRIFQNNESLNLMIIQGEIDLQNRHLRVADFTLFKENEERGGYAVDLWTEAMTWTLMPNLNVADAMLRSLFEDRRFREALNIAIDRETINVLAFSGLGEPRQASPISGSPFYSEELEQMWTGYDAGRADALLDAIGLSERDGDGFRLRPDGDRLSIVIETRWDTQSETLELVRSYWKDVGVEAIIRILDRTLVQQRIDTHEFEMVLDAFDRSSIITADPVRFLGKGGFAQGYFQWWNTGGAGGIEPSPDHPIREVWAAWESAQSAPTLEAANDFARDMVAVHAEHGWHIGIVGETPSVFVRKEAVMNFPVGFVNDDALRGIGLAYPQQIYFAQ